MEPELIIKSIMGLVALLALLIFFLFLEPNKNKKKGVKPAKPTQEKKSEPEVEESDLKVLVSIVRNKRSDAKKLANALHLILKHHGRVHKKMGLRAHPDFAVYEDILFTLCRHPHANKDLVIDFDRELAKLNPEYKQEINEAITKGLNSRGM